MAKQKNKTVTINNNVAVNSAETNQNVGSKPSARSKTPKFNPADFLRENWLVPVYIDDDNDPEKGRIFLGYGKYRLPFPSFETVEHACDYVLSHPVPVTLAIISCVESIKSEENETKS